MKFAEYRTGSSRYRTYCSARNCKSVSGKDKNLSFHRIPPQGKAKVPRYNHFGQLELVDKRIEWLRLLDIRYKINIKELHVCSLHFEANDYFFQDYPGYVIRKKRLKKDALPKPVKKKTREEIAEEYKEIQRQKRLKLLEKKQKELRAQLRAERLKSKNSITKEVPKPNNTFNVMTSDQTDLLSVQPNVPFDAVSAPNNLVLVPSVLIKVEVNPETYILPDNPDFTVENIKQEPCDEIKSENNFWEESMNIEICEDVKLFKLLDIIKSEHDYCLTTN